MLEGIKRLTRKKYFHIVMVISIVAVILFILGVVILKYSVEGETNMPFNLSKISIISSVGGIDKYANETRWAFDIFQGNDIFLYIEKNNQYGKTETIKSVKIDNIQVEGKNVENIKIYKPDGQDEKTIFKNKEENIVQSLEYIAQMQSNLKELKISNQGGLVAFRCSNDNIKEFTSNDDEIKHSELLKKAEISQEDINVKITFDLTITLESEKEYKTTINSQLPVGNVIEEGTTSTEITDLKEFVFKRMKQ